MAKRGALSEMNHDNWDQEEEGEDAGVFRQATQNVLKQRAIKKAKRRGVAGQADDAGGDGTASSTTAFKGFTGFVSSNLKPSFSFNKDSATPLGGFANGGSAPTFSLGGGATFGSLKPAVVAKSETEKTTESTLNGSSSVSRSKYLQQLRALNESVSKWISEHVSKNPHCVLTPIFKDYEKHLVDVEKLNPDNKSGSGQGSTAVTISDSAATGEKEEKSSPIKSTTETTKSTFSFSSGGSSTFTSSEAVKPSLFGSSTASSAPSLFGAPSATPAFGSGFSFKPSSGTTGDLKPFSFSSAGATAASQSKPAEEEDYEPPKVEVKEITEDDAFYSKKCKLYFQKSGTWTERGVGHIHLKPCGEKTQLIIRADTNLGNILLNIMLSSSIPLARQGKNNVSMMCMANPPIDPKEKDPKPTSFLVRVKTGEEADDLLEQLKKNQK